jgi:Protein of unknown function (DUF3352)
MRRALALLLTLAALAVTVAACGDSSSSSGNGFDAALGYVPKASGVVVAIKTDPDDSQYEDLNKLADKFPFAGTLKDRLKSSIEAGGTNYEDDIKPLLGNDLVIGVQTGGLETPDGKTPFVMAWQAKDDPDELIGKGNRKIGESDGATIYQGSSNFFAVKDDTVVASKERALLDTALRTESSGDGLTEDDFNAALGDLDKDALVRVEGNIQTLLAKDPEAAEALKVPWVKGLRTFGVTMSSASDGIAVDFAVKTEGVTADQQPLAAGPAAAPVVKRPGEVGVGLRGPAQIAKFIEDVAAVTDPKSLLNKDKVGNQLGVDLDTDVIDQLGESSASSIALDGAVAVRTELKDAATFKKTLATIMKNLPKAQRSQGKPVSTVENGPDGLYTVTEPGDKPQVVGVIGEVLVIASDADRAKEFAAQSAEPEAGTKGALVVAADPKAIVSEALKRRGNAGAAALIAPALSSHLDALRGSVESEADGLRGAFKLTIR